MFLASEESPGGRAKLIGSGHAFVEEVIRGSRKAVRLWRGGDI